jgi:hypothetical protein
MIITPDSQWGRELAKWNTPRNQVVRMSDDSVARDIHGEPIRGMNAVGYEPYPKMLYQAHPSPITGQPSVGDMPPDPLFVTDERQYAQQCLALESFNRRCQKEVGSEEEQRIAVGQGWCVSQQQALDQYDVAQQALARAAAEAAHAAQRLSARARQEFDTASDATAAHVADVPPPPRRSHHRRRVSPVPSPVPTPGSPVAPADVPDQRPPCPAAAGARPAAPELIVTTDRLALAAEDPTPTPPVTHGRGRPRTYPRP